MITIPITILDDFLDNPKTIREFGLSLNYSQSPMGNFPGKRTKCISTIHPPLFEYISKKTLSLFFPNSPITWEATMYFHLSKDLEKTGWIHQDPFQITSLIYLSPPTPNVNRGTSLYKLLSNKFHPYNSPKESDIYKNMPSHYITDKISQETYNKKSQWEEKTFHKILDIPDMFNRLICFDPSTYHANNNIKSPNSQDRLTLITFYNNLSHPSNFPIPRSKQTLSI